MRVAAATGSRILNALETKARRHGARKIVLNARDNALEFYRKRGVTTLLATLKTLFGVIRHVRMAKSLS